MESHESQQNIDNQMTSDPFVYSAVDDTQHGVAQHEVRQQASQMAQQLLEEVTKSFANESQTTIQSNLEQQIEQPFEFKPHEQPFVAHQQLIEERDIDRIDPFVERESSQLSYQSDVKQRNIEDELLFSSKTGVTAGANIESYDELMYGNAKQRFMESEEQFSEEAIFGLNRDDPFGTPKHQFTSEPYETMSTDFGMGSDRAETSDLLAFESSHEEVKPMKPIPEEVTGFVTSDNANQATLLHAKSEFIADHSQSSSDDEERRDSQVLPSVGRAYSSAAQADTTTQSTLSQQFEHNVTNDASICVSSAPNIANSSTQSADWSSAPNLEHPKVEAEQPRTATSIESQQSKRFDVKSEPIQQKPQQREKSSIGQPVMAQQQQQSSTSTASQSCPFAPSAWLNSQQLHPTVAELVYWRNPKKSGIVFGVGLILLLSLTFFSIISVTAYASLTTLMVTLSFRIYKNILQAVQKTNEGHPFKEYLDVEITPSNERVHQIVDTLLGHLNCTINRLRSVFLVEDIIDSLKYVLFFWSLTYIGSWFNGLTLVILSYLAFFSLPKVYEMNKTQIDHYLQLARNQISDIANKISAKIPFPAKKEKEN